MVAFLYVSPIQSFNNDHVHIRSNESGSYGHRLSEDGKFALDGNDGNWIDLVTSAIEQIEDALTILNNEHRNRPAQGPIAAVQGLHQRLRRMVL